MTPEDSPSTTPSDAASLGAALRAGPRTYLLSWWVWRAALWTGQAAIAGWLLVGSYAALLAPILSRSLSVIGAIFAVPALVGLVLAVSTAVAAWQRAAAMVLREPRIHVLGRFRFSIATPWWRQLRLLRSAVGPLLRELGGTLVVALWGVVCSVVVLVVGAAVYILLVDSEAPAWLWTVATASGNPAEYGPANAGWGELTAKVVGSGVLVAASPYLVGWSAQAGSLISAWALRTPPDVVRGQLAELAASRRRMSDAFDLERKRIERDLHDGAQQRIVAQAITLGSAALELSAVGEAGAAARELVRQARDENRQILADLRELVRGIHPQVLTDHGLAAALEEVSARHPTPVALHLDVPTRLPELVESTAYFVLLEALTNVSRHAQATMTTVACRLRRDRLYLEVRDNGQGEALLRPGGGLAGLADRVAAVDGALTVTSPPGGPTVVAAVLPCAPDAHWPADGTLDDAAPRDSVPDSATADTVATPTQHDEARTDG